MLHISGELDLSSCFEILIFRYVAKIFQYNFHPVIIALSDLNNLFASSDSSDHWSPLANFRTIKNEVEFNFYKLSLSPSLSFVFYSRFCDFDIDLEIGAHIISQIDDSSFPYLYSMEEINLIFTLLLMILIVFFTVIFYTVT